MKRFEVTLPFVGYSTFEVTAEDEDHAIERAINKDIHPSDVIEQSYCRDVSESEVEEQTATAIEIEEDDEEN